MGKSYINLPEVRIPASSYLVKIEYNNGEVLEKEITNYSYSDVFNWIKENHEGKYNRKAKSIKITAIR
ncbi:hypothetical protein DP145_01675 [Clostridium tetani]|uniref:hypothetical protein n=1 Tax=Clostridium tetani TaxID=1513 RepID=UPI00100A9C94|nr:hypothetical protein [Clostridium tetani]RXI46075.1 hypothetical protein DP126_07755 [Clostridium tetani]RXM61467.1 hypothetical protein DP138_04590 [Clostridium tetani]RXM70292.1 hypothetical protein DP145_01675 [Clostridium tetani]